MHGRQLAARAGIAGPALFVAIFLLQDAIRSDFNWLTTAVSEHSLGPCGWLQIASFVVGGTLMVVFAAGVAAQFPDGIASRAGPPMLALFGICLLLSGPFVTDPATVALGSQQATWQGTVHALLGAIVFTLMPLISLVFYRRFRIDAGWRALAPWTLAACLVTVAGIVLLKFAQLGLLGGYVGLVQRLVLIAFFGWVGVFAWALSRRIERSENAPKAGAAQRRQ